MFVEIGALAGGNYLIYKYLNRQYEKFEKAFKHLIDRIPSLHNNLGEAVKLLDYSKTDFGIEAKLLLPEGVNSQRFEEHLLTIREAFKLPTINVIYDNRVILLQGIINYKFKGYEPLKLPPNKLLIGEWMGNNIIVDQNKFPHCLVCGDTGTGKSFLLFSMLTNLISSSKNISLYLLQLRKSDLSVFKNCKQVKCCSRTLEEVLEALQEVDRECLRREEILDNEKGYLNISEYNKLSGQTLKYIYVIIEEFSFLNLDKSDSKGDKRIKSMCMKYLKSIVNAGRSSGVFLITSLQKPTSDSIPSDIKAMLTTRVALNIKDASTCRVVMDNSSAVNLAERQLVCRTKETVLGYSLTIDFPQIKQYTKDFIVNKDQVKPKVKVKSDSKNAADDLLKLLSL